MKIDRKNLSGDSPKAWGLIVIRAKSMGFK